MISLFRSITRIASFIIVFMTMMAYLCPHVNPVSFRWLAFLGTAYPWLLAANVGLLLIWAWRMNRFALYHLGIILLGWEYLTGFVGFDFEKDTVPESAITIATHNLGALFRGKKMSDALREKTAAEYARFLQENGDPDILCTQETSGKFYHLLAAKMGYSYNFNLKKGTVILSRYPMEGGGEIPFGKTANSTLWVDVRIADKVFRVYSVHLQSNKVTNDTERVIEEGELNDSETIHEIGSVLGRVGSATTIRAEQAQRLREHLQTSPRPVLVCGDFNDTPNSYVYSLLSEGLTDTFREKGLGFGTTFAGVLPLLRIDYILTENSCKILSCRTVHGDFSDHYPVFVSFVP